MHASFKALPFFSELTLKFRFVFCLDQIHDYLLALAVCHTVQIVTAAEEQERLLLEKRERDQAEQSMRRYDTQQSCLGITSFLSSRFRNVCLCVVPLVSVLISVCRITRLETMRHGQSLSGTHSGSGGIAAGGNPTVIAPTGSGVAVKIGSPRAASHSPQSLHADPQPSNPQTHLHGERAFTHVHHSPAEVLAPPKGGDVPTAAIPVSSSGDIRSVFMCENRIACCTLFTFFS